MLRRGFRTACCLTVATATGAALVTVAVSQEPAQAKERRLVGDWEPPDAYVVARQALWDDVVDRLLEILEPYPVYVVTDPDQHVRPTRRPGVAVLEMAHESAWVRDYGPIQVEDDGRSLWLNAEYYPHRPGDDSLPDRLGYLLDVPVEPLPTRFEGGAVVSDGQGLCVMTDTSARQLGGSDWRNGTARKQLGCREIVIVPALSSEPTGHVDFLIHFLRPDVVGVAALVTNSAPDADAARLDAAATLLERAASKLGRRLEIIRVPVYRGPDGRLFSYLNVLPLERRLLVPEFEAVPAGVQEEAYDVLRRASGKELVAVPADAVALAGGGLHCLVLGLHSSSSGHGPFEREVIASRELPFAGSLEPTDTASP